MLATNLDSNHRGRVMPDTKTKILVCNAGSSSLKFSLFDAEDEVFFAVRINAEVKRTIEEVTELAPLHGPPSLDGVERSVSGADIDDLGAKLQDEGAKSFVSSWNDLMEVIACRRASLATVG